jgi:glycosyltransferase involved in cell wall biosynthesis
MTSELLFVHASVEHTNASWGGITTAVNLAASMSSRVGLDSLVVSLAGVGSEAKLDERNGTRVVSVSDLDSAHFYQIEDRIGLGHRVSDQLFEIIDRERVGRDIHLMVHNEELESLFSMASSARWCRTKSAFAHGFVQQEFPDDIQKASQQERFFRAADVVFAASKSQVKLAETYFPDVNFRWLPLPLDLLNDEAAPYRSAIETRSPNLFVAGGRAVRQKGFDILFEAIHLVPSEIDFSTELFVGNGEPQIVRHCSDAALTLGSRARVHSWQSREKLLRVMARAKAVVVPSRFEPLGLIAAEALALRTPVIASNVGGLGDLVGGVAGNFLLDCKNGDGPNPSKLAEVLEAVVAMPKSDVPGPEYLARFTLERFADEIRRS